MTRESIPVSVKPTVMKWLIDSSGWTDDELAKRLRTTSQNIVKIKEGQQDPTYRQIVELSDIFKRPVAAFLLPAPKPEKQKPKDYRMLPDKVDKFDKKTILVLREARRLQELSKELSGNISYEIAAKLEKAGITDNPQATALKYRELFKLSEEKQRKLKNSYELFHYLRDILENINIYVFQFSMPIEDARGFVLVDETPNVIVVNTKDCIEARLFTLMHEFGHILLDESVIDLPDASSETKDDKEKWCDAFSSSFLLPKTIAKSAFEENKKVLTQKKTLEMLSKRYKVSKAVLLVKMNQLGYITPKDYYDIIHQYKPGLKRVGVGKKGGGGIPSDRKTISKVGNKFVSLVANNYDRHLITYADALNYLSIKSKNFDKVLAKAKK